MRGGACSLGCSTRLAQGQPLAVLGAADALLQAAMAGDITQHQAQDALQGMVLAQRGSCKL